MLSDSAQVSMKRTAARAQQLQTLRLLLATDNTAHAPLLPDIFWCAGNEFWSQGETAGAVTMVMSHIGPSLRWPLALAAMATTMAPCSLQQTVWLRKQEDQAGLALGIYCHEDDVREEKLKRMSRKVKLEDDGKCFTEQNKVAFRILASIS